MTARRHGTSSIEGIEGRRRVVVERVRPEIDDGRFPIKRTVGASVRVTAWIHADGHDALEAVLRYRPVPPRGRRSAWIERPMEPLGNDEWRCTFEIQQECRYEYTVHAWIARFESWRHQFQAKVGAGQDVSSELLEGAALIRAAAQRARAGRSEDEARWLDEQADQVGGRTDPVRAARVALDGRLADLVRQFPDGRDAAAYRRVLAVSVDRERARVGAWYELFPRSCGPDPNRSATLREAESCLGRVADMGFDVVYLPPIHPIGTSFRKGRGNTLRAAPGDPGSPWAIGSAAGGHKSIEPGLGTLEDFVHFVAAARRLGLEVALDLAFQCSPDHPYVREHPEWFRHRPDGTIKYAENPPKKYQDIYPFDFECDAWPALWAELRSIVEFWIARGVTIFRVDNPHTKPYPFWEWLIRDIRREHPEVIFLAEAFTRPKVMYYLAKLGFTQSYTYFTWRNTKAELTDYFSELTTTDVVEFFRPNLFANTPDILHAYLQQGGRPAFQIRLILAATLGATYGIYSGFELCENLAVPGTEDYVNSEKYQYLHRDWNQPGGIADLVLAINRIRRNHPALHFHEGLSFCQTDSPHLIAYCKISPDRSGAVLVVVNLDYAGAQHGHVDVPLERLGLHPHAAYDVVDQLDGARYTWRGRRNYVRLDPLVSVAHVFEVPVGAPEVVTRVGDALTQFLPHQRWFTGKGRRIRNTQVVAWSPTEPAESELLPTIASVEYAEGSPDQYFLPLAIVRDDPAVTGLSDDNTITRLAGVAVVDALANEAACRALLAAMLAGRSRPMSGGVIRASAYGREASPSGLSIRRAAAEQSNSGVVFGRRYVLKIVRRLDVGPNPELEVSRHLAARRFSSVPQLVASLEYERRGEEPRTLALVHRFIANEGTGWEAAVADAQSFVVGEPSSAARAEPTAFRFAAETLGRRTAELHRALADGADDPNFAPVELTPGDLKMFTERLHEDADRVLGLLAERQETLPGTTRDAARAVLEARSGLQAIIGAFEIGPAGSQRIRVHGDFHLGQVLMVDGDFVIVDFEGEPTRPLTERRAKHPPMKDVAGMLRSFGYAAHVALQGAAGQGQAPRDRLETRARIWESSISEAFLAGYRRTTAGTKLVPADGGSFRQLLDVFVLDKVLYELHYELTSRPAWITIPLDAILRIVEALGESADLS